MRLLIVVLMHKMRCASKNNFHTLLKIKSATDALIIICRNFSEQKFLKTATTDTFDSYFNGRLVTYNLLEMEMELELILSLLFFHFYISPSEF